ncbi:hypothetical protein D3C80_1739790 [compost metagenome]
MLYLSAMIPCWRAQASITSCIRRACGESTVYWQAAAMMRTTKSSASKISERIQAS